ncbi:Sensory neuron membrane protein 1 [Carabus blaptoides fortunei]
MVNKQNIPAIVGGTGIIILILGIFLGWYGFPKMANMKIKEGISLEKGTESYDMWEVIPFPLKFKVYVFNVQNPEEVQNGGHPVVREIGPFVYDEYRKKEKVVINEETDTIQYILRKTFFFNEKESGCHSDEDYVTVLNAALVGTALTVQGMFPSALATISDAVPHLFPGIKNIFMTVKVKDLLFNGLLLDCSNPSIDFVCSAMKGTAPETVRLHENNRDFLFSMFHHLNDTEEGPYVIGRGMKNTSRGEILSYKGDTTLEGLWNSPECNMLNGTDSTMYSPMEDPKDRLYIYSSDLCRSAYVSFEKKTETFGIPVFRYTNTERNLDIIEENDCFCPVGNDENFKPVIKCTPKGTMNLMPCMQSPTIYSNPHFYLGDRELNNFVTGLKPNKEKHQNFAEIEPLTGTPVRGMKRAQFSLFLRKLPEFELLTNVSHGLMPLIWLEEGATLPPFLVDKLKGAHSALYSLLVVKWFLVSLGLVMILIGVILHFRKDKIFCMNDSRVAHFNAPIPPGPEHKPTLSNSDNDFNSTLTYPSLYPQLVNRNMSIGIKKMGEDRFLI